MTAADPPPEGTTDLLTAVTAFAEQCRRQYQRRCRGSLEPIPTVVPPGLYDAIKAAVAEGTAPDWLATEFDAGLFIPTERLLIDEGL